MKALFEAIQNKFDGSTLATSLNGLWAYEAPQGVQLPYATYQLVGDTPSYTMGSTRDIAETALIQFSVFTGDDVVDGESAYERACTYADSLKTLFDECALTVDGYNFIRCARTSANLLREDGGWQYQLDYDITIQEAT